MDIFPATVSELSAAQRFELFKELLTCGVVIQSWIYGPDFYLAQTTSSQLVLHTIFEHTGCLAYMKKHFEQSASPLILSSYLGLMWCAAKGQVPGDTGPMDQYYVIGPVLNTDIPLETIQEAARSFHVDLKWREGFIHLIQSLPVVSHLLFFQYGLMLHYCATGEKLRRSDIEFQQSEQLQQAQGKKDSGKQVHKDRFRTYQIEQALLRNIREGDLDYSRALSMAQQISTGIQVSTKDPVNQVIISASGFVTLCVRAAIEGGLSPDVAYTLGDSYIQSIVNSKNISEISSLNHTMYEDFIQRVHKHRSNPDYSKQIQSCIDFIDLHLTEELSIQRLARRVGYTEYYLSHKFKEETGTTVKDYIKFARIERAKTLLTTTDLSVAQIAEQLHFCSSSYFSSRFREVIGALPQQYRAEKKRV